MPVSLSRAASLFLLIFLFIAGVDELIHEGLMLSVQWLFATLHWKCWEEPHQAWCWVTLTIKV